MPSETTVIRPAIRQTQNTVRKNLPSALKNRLAPLSVLTSDDVVSVVLSV